MIEKLDDSSDNVLGFKISGKIKKDDYDEFVPAVKAVVDIPVIPKLTPNTPDIAAIAEAAIAGEGPSGQSDTVETSAIPVPVTPAPDTAASVPDAAQTAALPETPFQAAAPEPASRVVLRATAISWVELRDADKKRVFSRLLKKGETFNVPGRRGITLATGNAGALDVLVDGQAIGPLGPVGAVRRNVLLEPDALLKRSNAGR